MDPVMILEMLSRQAVREKWKIIQSEEFGWNPLAFSLSLSTNVIKSGSVSSWKGISMVTDVICNLLLAKWTERRQRDEWWGLNVDKSGSLSHIQKLHNTTSMYKWMSLALRHTFKLYTAKSSILLQLRNSIIK